MFGVLRQLFQVENARKQIQALEDLIAFVKQLLVGDPARMMQLALDALNSDLEQARREFSSALLLYRDQLDALKVELGLSAHAPVVAEAQRLAPFRTLFAEIEQWQRNPERELGELPRLVNRLTPLESGVLDFATGKPKLADVAANPAKLEPVLVAAGSLAIKIQGGYDPDGRIELQVRRRLRHIVETHTAYEAAKRELVSLLRLKDDEFEKLMNPPPPVAEPMRQVLPVKRRDLISLNAAVNECESRLVSFWTTFHLDRLALARELRLLPASDWTSFYASFAVPLSANAHTPSKKP